MKIDKRRFTKILTIGLVITSVFLFFLYHLQKQLVDVYNANNSLVFSDRYGKEIIGLPNQNGYWARYLDKIPSRFKELLIKKEDKYFYYHFGFNPISIFEAVMGRLGIGNRRASSTITQQLAKILLGKEMERNIKNKIIESFYTLGLEIYQSKENILKMYLNSIYFGNQTEGLAEASRTYFNLPPDLLSDGQILQLLSTIHSPTENNPAQPTNNRNTISLAQTLNLDDKNLAMSSYALVKDNLNNYSRFNENYFEIKSLINDKSDNQSDNQLTIDLDLTEKVREILDRNIEELKPKNVNQGAVVIIKLPENEILTLIGSVNPRSAVEASQINMLEQPRPIGSTIKPFIYLKAFEKGLRPYTVVDDREYKYITALGFPLYPKNFDYKYRGEVTLHYALSNSLNVPAVKVLEYVGLDNFYNFLENDLGFQPIQDLNNYQLGIALGALEMKLLDLAHYFTIFPNQGILKDLKIYKNINNSPSKTIADAQYVELVNKILNDRKTGIEQFGMKSWLNLFQDNYALKTGTSRDFRDSWVVGYTPDFLTAVWVGNADNTPMDEVSGQIGAGRIWAQIMDVLLNSQYNKKTPFNFDLIKEFYNNGLEYGLNGEDYRKIRGLLKENDTSLILKPHSGDIFVLEKNSKIILQAKENVEWYVNDQFLNEGVEQIFSPQKIGLYKIKAKNQNGLEESVVVSVN